MSAPAFANDRAAEAEAPRWSPLVAGLFAHPVAAYELRAFGNGAPLMLEEAITCGSFRPRRLAEFAAGRSCARRALADLGLPGVPLRQNADRTPDWPANVAGSITHTLGFCGVVAGRGGNLAALGLDAEIVARVGREIWAHVLTPSELSAMEGLGSLEAERRAALLFSAKEAFYKCQFAVSRQWLDFADVAVSYRPEGGRDGSFAVTAQSARARWVLRGIEPAGRYRFEGALVVTGVELNAFDAARLAPPAPEFPR